MKPTIHPPAPPASRSAQLTRHFALLLGSAFLMANCSSDQVLGNDDGEDAGIDAAMPQPDAAPRPDAGGGPRCGDGVLDEGEECDDGNNLAGDGCSPTCTETKSPAPEDSCPGVEIPLTVSGASRTGQISGNNSELSADSETTCGGGNGRDALYHFVSDRSGRATVTLRADFAAILAQQSSCEAGASEVSCRAAEQVGDEVQLVLPVSEGQTYVFLVDALAGGAGNYTLDVNIADNDCGDGVAQLPEQCDDGNNVPGDGCDAACQLEVPTSEPGTCPGASYTLVGSPTQPVKVSFAGDTTLQEHVASGCSLSASSPSWSSSGRDAVYGITPTLSGALRVTLHPSFGRPSLHARGECHASATALDCAPSLAAEPRTLTLQVEANRTYFFFVDDGFGSSGGGTFTLDATLYPPLCGDGVVATPEQCDDGNLVDGDGCSSACTLEPSLAGINSCPGANMAFETGAGDTRSFRTLETTSRLAPGVWTSCGASQAANPGQRAINDAVYTFEAPYDGWFEADVVASFHAAVELRESCNVITGAAPGTTTPTNPFGTTAACVTTPGGSGTARVRRNIRAGTTYYVVVKGAAVSAGNNGLYDLSVRLRPSSCGNGVIEGGEACDDGPWEAGWSHASGCMANCQIAPPATVGIACNNGDPITLQETAPGSGEFAAKVDGGNWNRPNTGVTLATGCASAGNEHYFVVEPPIDGVLTVSSLASYTLFLAGRESCADLSFNTVPVKSCIANSREQSITYPVRAGQPFYIVAEAPNAQQRGRLELSLSLAAPSCGDGLIAGQEQCDDGNNTNGDGCSSTCQLEDIASTNLCPGADVTLTQTPGGTYAGTFTVTTATATNNYSGTCGGAGRDRVVRVVPPIAGTLTAEVVTPGWSSVAYTRTVCTDASSMPPTTTLTTSCKAADPTKPGDITRALEFEVVAGQPLFFFADGFPGQSGPASFRFVITP